MLYIYIPSVYTHTPYVLLPCLVPKHSETFRSTFLVLQHPLVVCFRQGKSTDPQRSVQILTTTGNWACTNSPYRQQKPWTSTFTPYIGLGIMIPSLKPRLSVPDFVSQLWRKTDFSPKLRDKVRNREPGFEAKWYPFYCTSDMMWQLQSPTLTNLDKFITQCES